MADKFQQLASECRIVFAVLGDAAKGKFEFADVSKDTVADFARRDDFIGMIGLSGMTPRTALAVELDDASGSALAQSFLALVEAAITRIEDSAGGIHKMSLP